MNTVSPLSNSLIRSSLTPNSMVSEKTGPKRIILNSHESTKNQNLEKRYHEAVKILESVSLGSYTQREVDFAGSNLPVIKTAHSTLTGGDQDHAHPKLAKLLDELEKNEIFKGLTKS